jgi:hypothetical protein
MTTKEELYRKVKILNETTWEHRANRPRIDKWLNNFSTDRDKLHALFLISQFMYFGSLQMRELLKALYRDLYKYPNIQEIRRNNGNTLDISLINTAFKGWQDKTRFLGVGNPSESGTHLLYFFRQENKLGKDLFINTHEIFDYDNGAFKLADPSIRHYVFIDDFCGSGSQAIEYSRSIVSLIKSLDPNIKASYLMLFTTTSGQEQVLNNTLFDDVNSVVELDESFKYFHSNSRYFKNPPSDIDKNYLKALCETHGEQHCRSTYAQTETEPLLSQYTDRDKLGFNDSQLLIGFHHNTPDNTLPIVWYDENLVDWWPAFKRYNKIYGI